MNARKPGEMSVDEFNAARGKRVSLPRASSSDVISIELPLPHKVLHPNGRTRNYKWRATVVKEYRELACIVAMPHRPVKPWAKARYRMTFWLNRRMDEDNLGAWVKSYLDGIQDASIVENDSGLTREEIVVLSGQTKTGGKTGVRFDIWEA